MIVSKLWLFFWEEIVIYSYIYLCYFSVMTESEIDNKMSFILYVFMFTDRYNSYYIYTWLVNIQYCLNALGSVLSIYSVATLIT